MMVEGTPTLIAGASFAPIPIDGARTIRVEATPAQPYGIRGVAASFR